MTKYRGLVHLRYTLDVEVEADNESDAKRKLHAMTLQELNDNKTMLAGGREVYNVTALLLTNNS